MTTKEQVAAEKSEGRGGAPSCPRCLLDENVPGVEVPEGGACTVCRQWDREWGGWEDEKEERLARLERLFADARARKKAYDVLVPLSGGKDSIYVLHQCRTRFNLHCLAVTWDNGFLTEHARENIRRACGRLGVDHVYYKGNSPLLRKLYRHFFLKTGMFCPVCMRGINVATRQAACAFDIPLIVKGTCLRLEEHVSREFFMTGEVDFFREVLQGSELEEAARSFYFTGRRSFRAGLQLFWREGGRRIRLHGAIDLPDYVEWDYDRIYRVIREELGWEAHEAEAEHTDCRVDNVVAYMRQKKFPALVPERLRYSKLVTAGALSREEGRERIADSPRSPVRPGNLPDFFDSLGITEEEFEAAMADPLRHLRYVKEPRGVLPTLRRWKHRLEGRATP
jgi:hypothetical protein